MHMQSDTVIVMVMVIALQEYCAKESQKEIK